jgi:hypothetical protein
MSKLRQEHLVQSDPLPYQRFQVDVEEVDLGTAVEGAATGTLVLHLPFGQDMGMWYFVLFQSCRWYYVGGVVTLRHSVCLRSVSQVAVLPMLAAFH